MSKWIDGDKLADSITDKLCDHLLCDDCPMRLDDGGCKVEEWLDDAPSIELIRCKECKHNPWNPNTEYSCIWDDAFADRPQTPNDFCSYGERRE